MALRIKDNIDLKELEKFGFHKANYKNKQIIYTTYKEGDISHFYMYKDRELYFETDKDNQIEEYQTDTLFDLIKAGLVEKVSD